MEEFVKKGTIPGTHVTTKKEVYYMQSTLVFERL